VAFAYDSYTNPSKNNGVLRATLTIFYSVFSVLFDSLAPAHLALRANLRLLYLPPATALGCG
jgi:hypothetical protein